MSEHTGTGEFEPEDRRQQRAFSDLRSTGMLWLINRVCFHPRGFALALTYEDSADAEPTGWLLQGDGSEVWEFTGGEDEKFAAVTRFLRRHTAPTAPPVDLRTPEQWCAEYGVTVVDPDGWRRPDALSWDEPIMLSDFYARLIRSTVNGITGTPWDRLARDAAAGR